MRRIALVLLGLALTAVSGSAAVQQANVIALIDGGLDRPARLVALDGRTLAVRARGPTMPGWAFGLEYARSPDGLRLAIFPRPSDAADRLFVVDVRTLRIVNRVAVGRPACSAAWPEPRRIVLIVAAPPCYSGEHPLEQVVVDPVEGRIVARRSIAGPAWSTGAAATAGGLALLLAPHVGGGAAQLVLASSDSLRTIPLPDVRGRDLALAVDHAGRRAFVVEPGWIVTEVDLEAGTVRRHVLGRTRTPAVVSKGTTGPVVEAAWAGNGALALAGGTGRRGRFVPAGARLIDTRTWRMRVLDTTAGSVAVGQGSIVTFQGPHDTGSADGTGAAFYAQRGRLRFRILAGKRVRVVRIRGHYAYVGAEPVTGGVFDLRDGSQTAEVDGNLVWSLLAGERGP